MRNRSSSHPLEHHPSFRAVIEAAPPLAELALHDASQETSGLVGTLVLACSDLVDGFAAPPESPRRARAHHRAWMAVRAIDRQVSAIGRRRVVPVATVRKAQRAIDRADVLVGALLPL
jgi:hypothetical protein